MAPSLLANQDIYGNFAGRGWEWVAIGYLLGGLWLWQRKADHLACTGFLHGAMNWFPAACGSQPGAVRQPLFHLFSGGAMIGAFFIATDPVSGCTTPRGKLIFGPAPACSPTSSASSAAARMVSPSPCCSMNLCVPGHRPADPARIFGMKDADKGS